MGSYIQFLCTVISYLEILEISGRFALYFLNTVCIKFGPIKIMVKIFNGGVLI